MLGDSAANINAFGEFMNKAATTNAVNSTEQYRFVVSMISHIHFQVVCDFRFSSSAEKEACEEAGVRGKAMPVIIGDYLYSRYGKAYRVSVVPVRFTEELSDWPEAFRERRWGTPHEISAVVASDKLRQIIESFSLDAIRADDN